MQTDIYSDIMCPPHGIGSLLPCMPTVDHEQCLIMRRLRTKLHQHLLLSAPNFPKQFSKPLVKTIGTRAYDKSDNIINSERFAIKFSQPR